jgi:hypothetical protein
MFNQEQINDLLKNKNVSKCSSKSITYSKDFKLLAIKKYYEEGYSPNMIFREAGFDIGVLGSERIRGCLKRWRKIYNNKGDTALMKENRGKTKWKKEKIPKNNKDKIKYLKTKIAYLEAENDFLAKLRGLKRKK